MRAAVLRAPRAVEVEEAPTPAPGPLDVLVRIEGCGVCGSSLPLWEGRPWFDYPRPPGEPGHEGWGVVEGVGRDVSAVRPGERVALLARHSFAEYDLAAEDAVVPLPPELDGLPFPGEALGCAVNVFRRSGVRGGERVAVVGVGFIGSAVRALCQGAGADVTAIGRETDVDQLEEAFDVVFECAGTQDALDTASRLVAVRGRLVVAGFHQDGPRTVDMQSWNWRGIDVVNAHERDPAEYIRGMREAAGLAAAGTLDVAALVTHRFPLERAADAFEAASTRGDGFVKAWVEP